MAAVKLITTFEELESERRKGIGELLPQTGVLREASLDNIRYFSDGIGDYNPLWRDEEYASKSRFGDVIAPPMWVIHVAIGGWTGVGNIARGRVTPKYFANNYAGLEMEFFRPICVGDKIHITERVGDQQRKESKRVGPILLGSGLTSYFNQRQELVATLNNTMARFRHTGRPMEYDRAPKAEALPEPPDPLVWERTRRGAETRYWEDVKEGEEIPTLKKGTFTEKELYFWFLVCRATGENRSRREATEGATYLSTGHLDVKYAAERRSMPGLFADAPHTMSWSTQIVTDWMGDDGTLKKFRSTCFHPNVVGDINTVYGKVVKKYTENGEHLIDIETSNKNQAELVTVASHATIALPSKG